MKFSLHFHNIKYRFYTYVGQINWKKSSVAKNVQPKRYESDKEIGIIFKCSTVEAHSDEQKKEYSNSGCLHKRTTVRGEVVYV